MARNDDGQGIQPGGASGGADGLRCTGSSGEVGICDGLSERYPPYLLPNVLLKMGPPQTQRQRETRSFPGEILAKLVRGLSKDGVLGIHHPLSAVGRDVISSREIKAGQRLVLGNQQEVADRTLDAT